MTVAALGHVDGRPHVRPEAGVLPGHHVLHHVEADGFLLLEEVEDPLAERGPEGRADPRGALPGADRVVSRLLILIRIKLALIRNHALTGTFASRAWPGLFRAVSVLFLLALVRFSLSWLEETGRYVLDRQGAAALAVVALRRLAPSPAGRRGGGGAATGWPPLTGRRLAAAAAAGSTPR